MTPRRSSPLAAAFLVVFASALIPTIVLGHAELDTVTPADSATIVGPPPEIVMTFTEALDPSGSSIRIVDRSGGLVLEGGTVDSGNPKVMRLGDTDGLVPHTYTIRWTSKSAVDGDIARGTTTFTVAEAASIAPSAGPSADAASPSVAGSVVPSSAPPVTSSSPPTAPAASTSDAVIPVVAALILLAALGLWLLRGRSRAR
jgi:methionine-rich copper-binding protein CopC